MSGRTKHNSNRPVTYKRQPVKIRQPKPGPLSVDPELVDEILLRSIKPGNTLKPKGACYDCDRPISGQRKFCGRCLAKH